MLKKHSFLFILALSVGAFSLALVSCQSDQSPSPSSTFAPLAGQGGDHHAEQIVFSGTGDSDLGDFGFWIWSMDDEASNPYAGEANGAIYLYELHLTKHVEGEVEENLDGSYTISVTADDGSIVAELTNVPPVVRGPNNTVNVDFTTPVGHGSSSNAIVNVTGPEEEEED